MPARRNSRSKGPLIGCGVDVVELARFRASLRTGGRRFLERVFTPRETAYADARRRTRLLHLAGRFAAKEAVIKAVSQVAAGRLLAMKQIEIRNDRFGRPYIVLHDRSPSRLRLHVSLSHVQSVAVASAIAVRERR